jgi:hypothetical protein
MIVNLHKMPSVKRWYELTFPTDKGGVDIISPGATFWGCLRCLDDYGDIYIYLMGCCNGDSIVRERVFAKLADIMNMDYDYIYGQWLKCHTHTPIFDEDCNFTGFFSESETVRRISLEVIEERYSAYNK